MGITRAFGEQYRKPTGLFGRLIARQMNRHHVALTKWAIDDAGIEEGDRILDIGSGGGMGLGLFAAAARNGSVEGIDYSSDMVALAAGRNDDGITAGRVAVREGTVSSLPFESDSFDHAFSIESFYYWPDYPEDLAEIRRVLKPSGRLTIVLEWSLDSTNAETIRPLARKMNCPLHSSDEIESMLASAGFVETKSRAKREQNWLLVSGVNPDV